METTKGYCTKKINKVFAKYNFRIKESYPKGYILVNSSNKNNFMVEDLLGKNTCPGMIEVEPELFRKINEGIDWNLRYESKILKMAGIDNLLISNVFLQKILNKGIDNQTI